MAEGPGHNPIVVYCKTCGERLLVRNSAAGKRGRCAACGAVVWIPLMSEKRPPNLPGAAPLPPLRDDKTIMIERLGSRHGLIIGGGIAAVVLLAAVGVVGYSLFLKEPAAASSSGEPNALPAADEVRPALSPAQAPLRPVQPARPNGRPAIGITFRNAGEFPLKLHLEHEWHETGVDRTLDPGKDLTLGLKPGTYKTVLGETAVEAMKVTKPETWTFTCTDAASEGRRGWQRRID